MSGLVTGGEEGRFPQHPSLPLPAPQQPSLPPCSHGAVPPCFPSAFVCAWTQEQPCSPGRGRGLHRPGPAGSPGPLPGGAAVLKYRCQPPDRLRAASPAPLHAGPRLTSLHAVLGGEQRGRWVSPFGGSSMLRAAQTEPCPGSEAGDPPLSQVSGPTFSRPPADSDVNDQGPGRVGGRGGEAAESSRRGRD